MVFGATPCNGAPWIDFSGGGGGGCVGRVTTRGAMGIFIAGADGVLTAGGGTVLTGDLGISPSGIGAAVSKSPESGESDPGGA